MRGGHDQRGRSSARSTSSGSIAGETPGTTGHRGKSGQRQPYGTTERNIDQLARKGFMSQESTPYSNLSPVSDAAQETASSSGQDAPRPEPPQPLRATNQLIVHARAELGRVIAGQRTVIEEVLIAVLCQGHALLEGVPGIAKTLIVKALGRLLGLGFQRVQATPDLMPADILGTSVLRPGTDSFSFHAGPVFTDLLLVDEINRMPPRTQAALLECMEERQVTSDGIARPLPENFTVFATQNPIDFEGTYPLPEAQLDRFLLKTHVAYPSEADERQVLALHLGSPTSTGSPLLDAAHIAPIAEGLLAAARHEVRSIRIEPELLTYILALV